MKPWVKYTLIGVIAFVIFAIAMAPASLLPRFTAQVPDLRLLDVRGSLWNGSANVVFRNQAVGDLTWRFDPTALASLAIGAHWQLQEPGGHDLSGRARATFGSHEIRAAGVIGATTLNRVLAPYFIALEGDVTIASLDVSVDPAAALPAIAGELNWAGGETRYRLGGQSHRVALPAMVAHLDSPAGEPKLVAYVQNDDVPLIEARIDQAGWVNIGITKRMTQLVGQPWAGSEPDHAIVLEVGEKLL